MFDSLELRCCEDMKGIVALEILRPVKFRDFRETGHRMFGETVVLGSFSNHEDDGDKNVINLQI